MRKEQGRRRDRKMKKRRLALEEIRKHDSMKRGREDKHMDEETKEA